MENDLPQYHKPEKQHHHSLLQPANSQAHQPCSTSDAPYPTHYQYPNQATKTCMGNFDNNKAAFLCYCLCPIMPLIFLFTEPKTNSFLRFHAIQSITYALSIILALLLILLLSTLLVILGGNIGVFLAMLLVSISCLPIVLLTTFSFVMFISCMLRAFQNERAEMPLIGKFAARIAP